MAKKVLVGCPTSEHKSYCLDKYAEAVKNLSYNNFDILLVDNSKNKDYYEKIRSLGLPVRKMDYCRGARERIVRARNLIRGVVVNGDYDYFLSLEQDVIPPKSIIESFLKHGRDVVSGVYFKDFVFRDTDGRIIKKEVLPLAYKMVDKQKGMMKQLDFNDVVGGGLIEVDACGLGCVLISKFMLKKIKFRYVVDKSPFDDIWFCKDVKKNGFNIYLDKSIKCKHLIEGMDWNKIKK